jgi:DNA-directed RNA polymerase subunit RPC12/RpoP
MDDQDLEQQALAIITNVKEWRHAHPKATYIQIEDEVHRRLMQLEASMIQDAAQESPSRIWGGDSGQEAVRCPRCDVPLHARGTHTRTLQGNGGQDVTLERTYGTCPTCRVRIFPPR